MRIILYSGKGGVGKTSLSAATAVRSARLGHRTLVVSTDAAHSLGDALEAEVESAPTSIAKNLHALEIDVNRELASHWGVIQEWLTRFLTFQGMDEAVAEEMAILPGMEELFSLLKVKRYADEKSYEVIVIDTAPTGETVRMLGVPEILQFYFKRIFPIQRTVLKSVRPVAKRVTDMPLPSDDVLAAVKGVYEELQGMGPLLQDPRRSSIRIVLNPERMVINESQRLYTYLNLFAFPVDAVVANRVLPPQARSEYFDKWMDIQAGHLAEARRNFDPLPFFQARLFDREMTGVKLLDELAGEVFGDKDPTAVFFSDRPVEVKREGRGYALYIRMPFAEKEDLQVWTHGEDLVVSVKNQRRNILLPRTLASRRLLGAALVEGRLRVAFGEREDHGR
ncbi:MAG TPA: ArsA family ATPase [Vicinamibacteria bacterium]|nr:ArsA family ATPase [Vicinamibacteria bacterium]